MKLKLDNSGRIVLPKPLRRRLGLSAGSALEAEETPNGVLIRRVNHSPSLVKVDGLWVHQGALEPGANWEKLVEDSREERTRNLIGM